MANTILFIIIAIILFEFALSKYLDFLNHKQWSAVLPKELNDLYEESEYKKAQEYDKANDKIKSISGILSTLIILGLLISGGFASINDYIINHYTSDPIYSALLFFAAIGIGSSLIGLPFSYYKTFVIEQQFGFNKMNKQTFVLDLIKSYFLGAILGGGLLYLFLWFYNTYPENFWWYAWVCISLFTIFFAMFYTDFIVPIFNKLTPLEAGELRTEIELFAQKVDFPLSNIMVLDGSKRSTKANAYFSGLGGRKKIVLFDTLIAEHSKEELTAILAHEVGHYKKKHIFTSMLLGVLQMGFMLYLLKLFIGNEFLSQALGADAHSVKLGLIGFTMLYSPVSMLTGILMNLLSRKNEYEADAYAKEYYNGEDLINALKQLSIKNLSNLNPHPSYVWFHYSHPTLLQRMKAIYQS